MKVKFIFFVLLPAASLLSAAPLYSPSWGFYLDLPEGYELAEGNNQDRYSFQGPHTAKFDIAVYQNVYRDIEQMARDIKRRLGNTGDAAFFDYGDKAAVLMELSFSDNVGWGLCIELSDGGADSQAPFLLLLSYAPAGGDLSVYHLSALNSLSPSEAERRRPGPVMEFGYPRGEYKKAKLGGTDINAQIREHDAEAAQALVDREFTLLQQYQSAENWQEAWTRYYRMIYRDSYERVLDAVRQLEWNLHGDADERGFAEKVLAYVQGFTYERNLRGSDFVNLVSAVTEGKGDCDSRAMLYAMILTQANIPAAIMVSRDYNHAMGLADIAGNGARFEAGGVKWLVAETTNPVGIGLIAQNMSNTESWLAVIFEE